MRIIFHHRIRSRDGQYVHLREMLEAFSAIGNEVTLVGPRIKDDTAFGHGGSAISWVRSHLPKWFGEIVELCYGVWAAVRLLMFVKSYRPDFVYERFNLFAPAGVLVCRLLRVPIVMEINAPLYEERLANGGLALKKLARWSQSLSWRWATLCCPVSQVLANSVMATGVPAERVLVRHNGIDPERYHPGIDRESAKNALGLSGKCVLGFIGFLREWHRVDRVIEVFATTDLPPEAHLLIAGDGPALPDLRNLCRELQVEDRVTFLGLVHWRDVPEVLAAFDIALQPAVTAYASPLKLIEYLACGLPVVAPAQENIQELIEHGRNGWVLEDSSVNGLGLALRRLCSDSELRARLGNAAALTIQERELTWTANARAVVAKISADAGAQ